MKCLNATLLAFASGAIAQQAAWGQCGGIGWTGATTCVSGYVCTYENDWFYQCIPGTATLTTSSTSSSATSVTTSSSSTTKVSSTSTKTTTSATSTSTAFAKVDGLQFNIDGVTKYYAGTNSYWLGMLSNSSDVDLVMNHLSSAGLKLVRVTGFNDVNSCSSDDTTTVWFQCFATGSDPVINTDGPTGLPLLDYAVEAAEKYDMKLILNFVNNWDDYGGMQAYLNYYGGEHNDWYNTTAIQAQYQKYIAAVISRYKSSNAIFAWELANEPRCTGCSTDVIYNWAKTTSEYIKSLDPNHMVTLGDEGFHPSAGNGDYVYTTAEGVSFAENINITTLDFATFHLYPSGYGESETGSFPSDWITAHAQLCVAAGKPCLLEEYGSTDNRTAEALWGTEALNTEGIGADMWWDAGDTLSWGTTYSDGYTIYPGSSDWTLVVTDHIADVNAKNAAK
ncbi:glycoside hydrolase superfamily [Xylariales sp. PMI_506]|nr:glycoside hydrolase superfamily [Xylariales sp. PMI_506]